MDGLFASTASTGEWIRNIPQGTLFDGNKKSNPDTDAPNDIGNLAYVTGVNTTNASIHDVDDGMTTLSSPLFDISSLDNPEIEYALWFFNGGGAGTAPNDYLEVFIANSLDNGISRISKKQLWPIRFLERKKQNKYRRALRKIPPLLESLSLLKMQIQDI